MRKNVFFLLFCLVNHLATPQIYLVTLWRGPDLTVYKVIKTSSTSTRYSSKMLLTH